MRGRVMFADGSDPDVVTKYSTYDEKYGVVIETFENRLVEEKLVE